MKNTLTILALLISVLSNAQDFDINDSLSVDSKNKTAIGAIALKEVVVYGERATQQIVKQAIDSLKQNYPDLKIGSKIHTNITATIDAKNCLDMNFTANQYEKGYFSAVRSMKKLKEVKWNLKGVYEPRNLWEFYGLMKHNPIRFAVFLDTRKFKKFSFTLEKVIQYNNKEVFVISFSSPRDHLTYTRRMYSSNYTGKLYINKDDYAIVKVIEDWEVKKLTERQEISLNLKGDYSNYTQKEYSHERIESDFELINGLYYLSHSLIDINGKIIDRENKKSLPFTTRLDVYWTNFNTTNPEEIKQKEEEVLFDNIKYNKPFWDTYRFPKKK